MPPSSFCSVKGDWCLGRVPAVKKEISLESLRWGDEWIVVPGSVHMHTGRPAVSGKADLWS